MLPLEEFLCPRLPKAGVGHIAFRCDVTSVFAYVTFVTSLQVYMQVYLHIYIHIYVQVAHNFDTFYATKLKFGMLFTKTKRFHGRVVFGLAAGWGQGSECITDHIEHMHNDNKTVSLVPLLALES